MAATFSQRLFELIDLRGMEEGVVCKRANMKSVLFSKFKGNPEYWPTKATALALAIALELNLWETRYFISLAGHTLSGSGRFDRIIEHFIVAGEYNIFLINRALFDFDQPQLGGW